MVRQHTNSRLRVPCMSIPRLSFVTKPADYNSNVVDYVALLNDARQNSRQLIGFWTLPSRIPFRIPSLSGRAYSLPFPLPLCPSTLLWRFLLKRILNLEYAASKQNRSMSMILIVNCSFPSVKLCQISETIICCVNGLIPCMANPTERLLFPQKGSASTQEISLLCKDCKHPPAAILHEISIFSRGGSSLILKTCFFSTMKRLIWKELYHPKAILRIIVSAQS